MICRLLLLTSPWYNPSLRFDALFPADLLLICLETANWTSTGQLGLSCGRCQSGEQGKEKDKSEISLKDTSAVLVFFAI
eukprot:751474-Hanusia_phi.AAC.3